jgi:hypothetical protein
MLVETLGFPVIMTMMESLCASSAPFRKSIPEMGVM